MIRVEGLTQYFLDKKPVLKKIDLVIEPGQLVLVVGPSGGGKSTLAYCIKGVIPHQMESMIEGRIEVDGLDTQEHLPAELATKVGMVFQDPEAQLCNLYIDDEVAFGPENLKLDRDTIEERIRESLRLVGLEDESLKTKFVYEISGGQKQRLAIASVLAMSPNVLIFDEPSANLDPQGGREVFEAIKHLHKQGFTILVIEHKIEELIDVADRMVMVDGGRIAYDGHPRTLLAEHGKTLKESHGLWLPEVSEIALDLKNDIAWDPFPLSVAELAGQIYPKILSLPDTPAEANPAARSANGRPRNEAQDIVSTQGLRYAYPDGTLALKGIDFNIRRGETIGIAGTNGSGKTTLAKILVGLLKPTGGGAQVCGMNVAKTSTFNITEKVGYVFQYPEHQFLKENVYDEVAYGLEVHGHGAEEIRAKTLEILELFGLDEFKERHPLALSGGQKRRLSVATALVLTPELLILDEPTFGQDQDKTRRMMEYLLQKITLRREMTTVMITHDMELLAHYCDRALILSGGELVFDGPPRALFSRPEILDKGSLKNILVRELVSALNERGCRVPDLITVGEFVNWYSQRAGLQSRHLETLGTVM